MPVCSARWGVGRSKYGKKFKWFFYTHRERLADGSLGYFVYEMPSEQAAWVRKAAGRPVPE